MSKDRRATKGLPALKEVKVLRVYRGVLVRRDTKAHREFKDLLERKARREGKGRKAHKVLRVSKATKAFRVLRAPLQLFRVRRDTKAFRD